MHRETVLDSGGAGKPVSILTWRVHLLKEEPDRALFIAPLLALCTLASYAFFHSLLSALVVLSLLLVSLADFLFPIRFEITTEGASSRTLFSRTFIEWRRVRKYYLDAHGIKLSPLQTPGRREAFRGVYLRFGAHKDEVIEVVRRMKNDAAAVAGDR